MSKKSVSVESIKKAVEQQKAQQTESKKADKKADSKKADKTAEQKVVIDFDAVKKALADIDSRFVVYNDYIDNDRATYCSIRLVLQDSTIDTRRVFCLYYNTSSVTVHCAVRFASVCSEIYHLNKKQTEYTHSFKLDELHDAVVALLKHELARLKMSEYVAKQTTAQQKVKTSKIAK